MRSHLVRAPGPNVDKHQIAIMTAFPELGSMPGAGP
jgi:hypothetical protein